MTDSTDPHPGPAAPSDGADVGQVPTDPARSLVDELLPTAWPAYIAQGLAVWRTGHLVSDPVFSWAGPAAADPVTDADAGGEHSYDWEPVADPGLTVPYGLVVSQTCDIVATGPGAKHPFVDVVPVFRADRYLSSRKEIEQFKRNYLVALTAPPADGFWVADLRLTMPVSKTLLAARTPLPGFAAEDDLLNLAEAVARKRRRPALHDVLSETLPRSLDDYADEQAKTKPPAPPGWLEKVDQVRLRETNGRLQPDDAQLWVLQQTSLDPAETQVWRGWHARGERLLRKAGIGLLSTQFTDLDRMSARLYSETVPVAVKALGRPPTW